MGVIVFSGGDDGGKQTATGGGGGEIFLQPIASAGPDPFSQSFAQGTSSSTIPPNTPITLSGNPPITAPTFTTAGGPPVTDGALTTTAIAGNTPGLYGGTRDQSSCDKKAMIDFLAGNADKAAAWAKTQGIPVGNVGQYIDKLTPALLRGDTRVTNHGFANGQANPLQAVLQAGTAVLVDEFGTPRARCACGNPLVPPVAVSVAPKYNGPPWQGFSPANVTVINTSTTVINIFILIDINNGTPFARQPGNPGGPDLTVPTLPGTTLPGVTTTRPGGGTTTTAGATGEFILVDTQVTGQHAAWTVDAARGTARSTVPGQIDDYTWTVPQRINPAGTRIEYSARTSAANGAPGITPQNVNTPIIFTPGFPENQIYAVGGGSKTATITVTANVREVKLAYGMGFSVTVTYTYRR